MTCWLGATACRKSATTTPSMPGLAAHLSAMWTRGAFSLTRWRRTRRKAARYSRFRSKRANSSSPAFLPAHRFSRRMHSVRRMLSRTEFCTETATAQCSFWSIGGASTTRKPNTPAFTWRRLRVIRCSRIAATQNLTGSLSTGCIPS
ncbi:hypothetical protein SDC9_208432 [bioreactor metagenome]|uniref:Uncharacterized protein n=1 Tax=bioreactor metagenome TaxID=1076179 RepID=A0A645JAS0_9ZZZZ